MRHARIHRFLTISLGLVAAVLLPAAAQVLPGPMIVNDPLNKVVLLQQLQQLEQQLQVAEANVKNIGTGGWGSTIQNVQQVNSELSSIGSVVNRIAPQSVPAQTAELQLQQIPTQVSALSYAQQLSDQAAGEVQATAAGNRLQSLTIGQLQADNELMVSSVLQNEAYEQEDTAQQTNPAALHALDGKL